MTWYQNSGKDSDIVLSTRVRLARNLRDFPFPNRLDKNECRKVNETVRDVLLAGDDSLFYTEMSALNSY